MADKWHEAQCVDYYWVWKFLKEKFSYMGLLPIKSKRDFYELSAVPVRSGENSNKFDKCDSVQMHTHEKQQQQQK